MYNATYVCDKNNQHRFTRFTSEELDNRLRCVNCDGWMHPEEPEPFYYSPLDKFVKKLKGLFT